MSVCRQLKWYYLLLMLSLCSMRLGRRCSSVVAMSSERFGQTRLASLYQPGVLKPVLISIEGNIGAGKTTLLNNLKGRNPDWNFIDEPVDNWATIKNAHGDSILEVFYKDRKRWSYTFQNCALLTRHQTIESSVRQAQVTGKMGAQVFLTERCLDTDYHVFTKMLRDEGSIDTLELQLYEMLLAQLRSTATRLAGIVHVDTEPVTCQRRIKQRSRGGEEAISIDYLQALDMHQCKWVGETDLPTTKMSWHDDIIGIEKFIREQQLDAQMPQKAGNEQPDYEQFAVNTP